MNLDNFSLDNLFRLIDWAWNGAGEIGRRAWLIPVVKKLCAMALDRLRKTVTITIPHLKGNPKLYEPVIHAASASGVLRMTGTVTATVLPAIPRC